MHQRKQFRQRSLIIAPFAEQLVTAFRVDLGVVIEECSPPQIVSPSTDFYSTAGS
jgi:hypothetical protein